MQQAVNLYYGGSIPSPPAMKTRYRTISNGYWEILQYEVVQTYTVGFWFLKKTVERKYWADVPRPYYDEIWGRNLDAVKSDTVVTSLKYDLNRFVKDYPDIKVWLEDYDKKQAELVENARKKRAERDENRRKVRYFE